MGSEGLWALGVCGHWGFVGTGGWWALGVGGLWGFRIARRAEVCNSFAEEGVRATHRGLLWASRDLILGVLRDSICSAG